MIREPRLVDLVEYICAVQPELDARSAAELLGLDGCVEWLTRRWIDQHITAQSLLDLYLETAKANA